MDFRLGGGLLGHQSENWTVGTASAAGKVLDHSPEVQSSWFPDVKAKLNCLRATLQWTLAGDNSFPNCCFLF